MSYEPIEPTDFTFTNENQRKHSYCHWCRGCFLVDDFIPADSEGLHVNCPAGRSSIGWSDPTREVWHTYTEEQKEAYRAEVKARRIRVNKYITDSINASKPHCPTCNSINLRKLSSLERSFSVFIWGIASNKLNKQFKCNDCGFMW